VGLWVGEQQRMKGRGGGELMVLWVWPEEDREWLSIMSSCEGRRRWRKTTPDVADWRLGLQPGAT
jgi:hypothetical protein